MRASANTDAQELGGIGLLAWHLVCDMSQACLWCNMCLPLALDGTACLPLGNTDSRRDHPHGPLQSPWAAASWRPP